MNPTTPLHEDTLIDLPPETPHQEAQRCTRNNPCRMQGCMICPTPTNHVRNLGEELNIDESNSTFFNFGFFTKKFAAGLLLRS